MKKTFITIIAISLLGFACSSGSASSLDSKASAAEVSKVSDEPAGKPVMLTKKDFLEKVMNYEKNQTEWVYEGDKPAIIDFYADWCAPCRIAGPILEELAAEYKGKIIIYKVDTEAERELAAVFGIQGIPAFLFIPAEGRPTMSSGIAQTPEETKEMFRQMIDELLLGKKPNEG